MATEIKRITDTEWKQSMRKLRDQLLAAIAHEDSCKVHAKAAKERVTELTQAYIDAGGEDDLPLFTEEES